MRLDTTTPGVMTALDYLHSVKRNALKKALEVILHRSYMTLVVTRTSINPLTTLCMYHPITRFPDQPPPHPRPSYKTVAIDDYGTLGEQ